jgi:hypothetical protein
MRHNTQNYISICLRCPAPCPHSITRLPFTAPLGLVMSRDRVIEDCNDALAAIFAARGPI